MKRVSGSGSAVSLSPVDWALPAALLLIGTAEITVAGYTPALTALASFWVANALLLARRRAPAVVPIGISLVYALTPTLGFDVSEPASWLLTLGLAAFSAGRYAGRAGVWGGFTAVVIEGIVVFAALDSLTDFEPDVLFGAALLGGSWSVGLLLFRALDRAQRAGRDAAAARAESELVAAEAVVAERGRMARELHDILARSLGVIVVHAAVAEDALEVDHEMARRSVRLIQETGQSALEDTGQLIRQARYGADENLSFEPTIDDTPRLVEEFQGRGLDVRLVSDIPMNLPSEVSNLAYRVVHEGLTNVFKHARTGSGFVRLDQTDSSLTVEVENSAPARPFQPPPPSGFGLIGLSDRVDQLGGSLEATTNQSGGHVLRVRLPTDPQQA